MRQWGRWIGVAAVCAMPSAGFGQVFFTNNSGSSIDLVQSVPAAGGPVSTLVQYTNLPLYTPWGIGVDPVAQVVYYGNSNTNTITSVPVAGGTPTAVLTAPAGVTGIAVNHAAGTLYAATSSGVYRYNLDGTGQT